MPSPSQQQQEPKSERDEHGDGRRGDSTSRSAGERVAPAKRSRSPVQRKEHRESSPRRSRDEHRTRSRSRDRDTNRDSSRGRNIDRDRNNNRDKGERARVDRDKDRHRRGDTDVRDKVERHESNKRPLGSDRGRDERGRGVERDDRRDRPRLGESRASAPGADAADTRATGQLRNEQVFQEFCQNDDEAEPAVPKQKANFEVSGKLAEETNTFRGVVIKYNQPENARVPKMRWRLYPFKGEEALPIIYIHRQSAYLIGRERKICDIAMDHLSVSGQHAVIQYRAVPDPETKKIKTKPYVIDLNSANGTLLNDEKIEPQRYYELKTKDVLKFGFSTREYVVMNEGAKAETDILE